MSPPTEPAAPAPKSSAPAPPSAEKATAEKPAAEPRLAATFARLATGGRKALIAYLCMGDPSVDESVDLALACLEAGADILELGIPFSDPTADGPAIARASQRAIAQGGGLAATLRAAERIRARTTAPMVLFGYYNPLFVYGEDRALRAAEAAGADALLVVDLPVEESEGLRGRAAARGISIVPLLAPTSSAARVDRVAEAAQRGGPGAIAFVYYVSVTGVTGSRAAPLEEARAQAGALRARLRTPVVVGFGIDSPDKARAAVQHADGAVVGTALVRQIEESSSSAERLKRVSALIRGLRAGIDS